MFCIVIIQIQHKNSKEVGSWKKDGRQKMEDGRPETEDGRWKTEDRRWKTEDRRRKMEDRRQKMEESPERVKANSVGQRPMLKSTNTNKALKGRKKEIKNGSSKTGVGS